MSILRQAIAYLLNPRTSLDAPDKPDVNEVDAAPLGRASSPLQLRDFVFNLPLLVGLLLVLGLIFAMLFGPLWTPHDPYITAQTTLPHFDAETGTMIRLPFLPSAEHPLGTDNWGNDMLSLVLYGARVTLVVGAYVTLIRLVIGGIMGSVAGWFAGRMPDRIVSAIIGVLASVPMLLSAYLFIFALGIQKGPLVFLVALSLVGWTEISQYVRAEILVLREMAYIEGARMTGLSDLQIVVRHLLPNLLPQLLIFSCLEMGAVLILIAELGFLHVFVGGGVLFTMDPVFGQAISVPEVPEWGALVAQGVPLVRSYPHLVLAPAVAFFLAVVGFNAFGEGLRRLLEKSSAHTAFLLRRRTFVALVVFAVLSAYVLKLTGPEFSYERVATAFESERAGQFVDELGQLKQTEETLPSTHQSPAANYIKDRFVEYGLQMGWKPEGQPGRSYYRTHQTSAGEETEAVVGFWPGYDFNLSTEMIVLMATYEEESLKHSGSVALLLEMARLWQEQGVDPRRSLLFVAWNENNIDPDSIRSFLDGDDNFTALPVPSRELVRPAALFQMDEVASGTEPLWLDPGSDKRLLRLFTDSANDVDVPVTQGNTSESMLFATKLPSLAFRWSDPEPVATGANLERLEAAGEVLSLTLLKVVRQPAY